MVRSLTGGGLSLRSPPLDSCDRHSAFFENAECLADHFTGTKLEPLFDRTEHAAAAALGPFVPIAGMMAAETETARPVFGGSLVVYIASHPIVTVAPAVWEQPRQPDVGVVAQTGFDRVKIDAVAAAEAGARLLLRRSIIQVERHCRGSKGRSRSGYCCFNDSRNTAGGV